MNEALLIIIIGNLIPVLFGIYAIRQWRLKKYSGNQIIRELGFRPFSRIQLIYGLSIGAIVFTIIFLVFIKSNFLVINNFSWTSSNLLITLLIFAILAIGEELVFRSFFINGLKQFTKSIVLILIISSLFFSIVHWFNDGSTILSSVSSFIGGLMYGYAFIRTEKLWLPIGLHFSWNFFQGFVFGFPVSGYVIVGFFETTISGSELWTGGSYGPEGGLIGIIARIFVIVSIWVLTQNRKRNKIASR